MLCRFGFDDDTYLRALVYQDRRPVAIGEGDDKGVFFALLMSYLVRELGLVGQGFYGGQARPVPRDFR